MKRREQRHANTWKRGELVPSRRSSSVAPARVLLTGPHGGMNLGDEYILHCIATAVRDAGAVATSASEDPKYTSLHHSIPSLQGINVKHRRLRTLVALRQFDLVVVAGGEQLQLGRFGNPLWGLLMNAWLVSWSAQRVGVQVFLYAVGAESIKGRLGRAVLRSLLRNANCVTARDSTSRRNLLDVLPTAEVHLVADPVFAVKEQHKGRARAWLADRYGLDAEAPLVVFCPANDRRNDLGAFDAVASALRDVVSSHGGQVLVLAMEHQEGYDEVLLERPSLAGLPFVKAPMEPFNASHLASTFAGVDLVVSARMHPLILAITQSTPWISLNRNAKLRNFCSLVGEEGLDPADVPGLRQALDAALGAASTAPRATDARVAAGLRERANLSAELVRACFRSHAA